MEMEYVLNQLVNGLCQGAIYALMAIGYSVIVGVVGMVTFTYGEIMRALIINVELDVREIHHM